jgi:hypothetical protein
VKVFTKTMITPLFILCAMIDGNRDFRASASIPKTIPSTKIGRNPTGS